MRSVAKADIGVGLGNEPISEPDPISGGSSTSLLAFDYIDYNLCRVAVSIEVLPGVKALSLSSKKDISVLFLYLFLLIDLKNNIY